MSERKLENVITVDMEDWGMLRNADNPRHIFSIQGPRMIENRQALDAFNRGVDLGWFTLVDVSVAGRMFKLTPAGVIRLAQVRALFQTEEETTK